MCHEARVGEVRRLVWEEPEVRRVEAGRPAF
jgi:hypothetical protein